jgi:hypothetical protein
MPITKTHEEIIRVTGNIAEWFDRCADSLFEGPFKNVRADDESFIADADYNSFVTLGSIRIVLTEERGDIEIAIRISAAVDNIWAYFWEPRQTILKAFKTRLPS